MTKPDCDDGWYKLSHELDEALAFSGFSRLARIVLRQVFAQIYGPAKCKVAQLSPTTIAKIAVSNRSHIARAIKELVDAKALTFHAGYMFTKDYEKWRRNGKPRFGKAEIESIRAAPQRAMAFKVADNATAHDNNSVTKSGNGLLPNLVTVTKSGNGLLPNLATSVTKSGNKPLPNLVTPMPRARVLETRRLKTSTTSSISHAGAGDGGKPDLTATLVAACPGLGLPADFPAKLRAERRVLIKEFRDDPSWFLGAMRAAAESLDAIEKLFPWCLTTAKGYRDDGAISEEHAAPKAQPQPAAPRPEPPRCIGPPPGSKLADLSTLAAAVRRPPRIAPPMPRFTDPDDKETKA